VIFVDTSFWVALTLPRDRLHRQAVKLLGLVAGQELITSNHVAGETWTFIRTRQDHGVASRFVDSLRRSRQTTVEYVATELEDEAWAWLRRHDERVYSFVDATSFALMRKLRISDALAFDGDFAAAGFTELRE
jgi:predicted nucleic acid-binding protein